MYICVYVCCVCMCVLHLHALLKDYVIIVTVLINRALSFPFRQNPTRKVNV